MNPLWIIGFVFLVLVIWVGWAFSQISRLPKNSPQKFLEISHKNAKPVIIFVGDSLTHGTVQPNWTLLVESALGDNFQYVNAGVNGETTADVLLRVDEIIACNPDYITLLIGNNNVMGTMERNNRNYKDSAQQGKWTQPDYEKELKVIISLFQATNAHLGVFSLVPYTEIIDSDEFQLTKTYSQSVKSIASEFDIDYFPLFETIENGIIEHGTFADTPDASQDLKLMLIGTVLRRNMFRQSWETISHKHRMNYLVDTIHINSKTADIMAKMVIDFIESKE